MGQRRSRAKSGWAPLTVGGRELLLSADDERGARRILGELEAELTPVAALHVTAGSKPGVAASLSVEPGHAAQGLGMLRALAEKLTA